MKKENTWLDFQINTLGSTTAGFIGRTICHPIDTLKSRLQSLEYSSYNSISQILKSTFHEEGWKGLYRGYGIVTFGGIPGVCIYLTSYEISKDYILKVSNNVSPFIAYFCSGIIAEALCCVVFVPVDVIKERIQVQSLSQAQSGKLVYNGSVDAIQQIWKKEGLSGLYRGYGATILSYSPFSALYFVIYEEAKKRLIGGNNSEISFRDSLLSSAFAGSTASFVTSPLDMAKLRLQLQRGSLASGTIANENMYSGIVDVLTKVFRTNGITGLFRGATARVLFHTPSTAITMAVFEECKRFWGKILN